MKVGIIGSGGREHAICQALSKSNKVDELYCFPGNAGTALIAKNIALNVENFNELKNFLLSNKMGKTNQEYVYKNKGATALVYSKIKKYL